MLDAAAAIRNDDRVRFLIVGRGPRLAEVEAGAARRRLPNMIFKPHQDRASLAESLGAADVHLSVLQPRFEGLVHPSKLYGIMAAGRPTLFVGDSKGETGAILEQAGAGLSVESGNAAALVSAIERLRDDPELCSRMGAAARRAFDDLYAMPIALEKWRELLNRLGAD